MNLLTEEIKKRLPGLYKTENVELGDKIAQVKFFHPLSNWTWYGVEYDPNDQLFFGLVYGFEKEWGYFSLAEMEEIMVHGLGIERDLYFEPKTIKEIEKEHGH